MINFAFFKSQKIVFSFVIVTFFSPVSFAEQNPIKIHIANPQLVGAGRMTFLFFNIYDAELYASEKKWNKNKPFALKLTYLRNFKGREISKRSVEEIFKLGFDTKEILDNWQGQMDAIFPDVVSGSVIIGIKDSNGHAVFYYDEKFIGSIKDVEFTRWFFDIWLGRKSSDLRLRAKLINADG